MYILLVLIIFTIIFLIVNVYEITHFTITEYTIRTNKNVDETNFVVLSDLHCTEYGKNNERLTRYIGEAKCDFVVIAGDMVTGKKECDWSKTADLIKKISENNTVYYVNGNHEVRTRDYPEKYGDKYSVYKQYLEDSGVVFLENKSELYNNVAIFGYEIPKKYYAKGRKMELNVQDITETLGNAYREKYNILVAHNPRYMNDYLKWSPDLIISGHFHGGMVRLPYIGGVLSPQFDLFPHYSGGYYRSGDSDVVVSRGLGTHSIPVRIFNKPEMIKIKLQKKP